MDEIESDVLTMAGGQFTPASLTPEGFETIRFRARANANAYLDAFERLYLGPNFDAEWHSDILASVFLEHLRDVAPERVRALAKSLLRLYDAVLVIFDQYPDKAALDELLPRETTNYLVRLSEHRRELRRLAEEP